MESISRYCSLDTQSVVHDLVGSIEFRPHQIFLEVAEPWDKTFSLSRHFPPRLALTLKMLAKKGKLVTTSLFTPDPEYSSPKGLRFIYLRAKPEALRYDKFEFVLPLDSFSESVDQIISSPSPDQEFPIHRVNTNSLRDYFICGHFNRDRCCGVFGQALYEKMRKDPKIAKLGIRIFKCSHIGGHRYAPTMIESPTMGCWGLLTEDTTRQILFREGDIGSVIDHYRGSSLFDSPFFQVADREMLRRYGWDWLTMPDKNLSGEIEKTRGTVTVSTNFKGKQEKHCIETHNADPILLRANCDNNEAQPFPQYRIKSVSSL